MTTLAILFLISFVWISWVGPRYGGLFGLLAAHISILVGYFLLAGLSIASGAYEYDGILSHFALLIGAFVLNCLLLPVAISALWQRNKSLTKQLAGG